MVLFIAYGEPYVAVYACAFVVPSFFGHGVAAYGQQVVAAVVEVFGEVVDLAGVAAWFVSEVEAVAEYLCVAEYALEGDVYVASFVVFVDVEVVSVPADAVIGVAPSYLFVAV